MKPNLLAPSAPVAATAKGFGMTPLRFIVTAIAALLASLVLLLLRPEILSTYHYNQYVISTTHLFVLGWLLSVVMGAMYQLVPVALETRLFSERLARWHFWLHLTGFVGMVWMFWSWNLKHVGHFGAVLALGVGLFVYNLVRTLARVPRWNLVSSAVACVLAWLSLSILAGLTIATAKSGMELSTVSQSNAFVQWAAPVFRGAARFTGQFDPISAMHAHAHLGGLGVFALILMGVSFKLVPMFTLSEVQNQRRAAASVLLVNGGLLGAIYAIAVRSAWKPVFAGLIVAGLAVYALELRAILRARKRRSLDWALKYFLTGIWMLLPLCLLGAVLSWPNLPLNQLTGQLENTYGLIAFAGLLSLAIVGMLYKIVPFLVWQSVYSSQIGVRKVPALSDLYSRRLQAWSYWAYLAGLAGAVCGTVSGNAMIVRAGAFALLTSISLLAANIVKILRHLNLTETAPRATTSATLSPTQPAIP